MNMMPQDPSNRQSVFVAAAALSTRDISVFQFFSVKYAS